MIALLFWSLFVSPCAVPAAPSFAVVHAQEDPEFDAKLAAAGRDVAKLLALAETYVSGAKDVSAKKVFKKVLEIEPDNETAHKGLGHQLYDKKWYESFAELAKYKREEAARMKAKGLVRFKDEWVPEGDLPFLTMGWIKNTANVWVHPLDIARAAQAAEWQAAGYQFRADDNSWIAPADVAHWTALQWKCGEEWLDLAQANEFHAKLGQWWQLVGEHFTVWTTCDWAAGDAARWYAEKSYPELVRIFGVEPATKPVFAVMNNLAQYNQVSGGNPPLLPESEGISSLHGAYFADSNVDFTQKPPLYQGLGVSFWDRGDEKLRGWGPYWLRWAAAQSFVDAVDPSWTAISETLSNTATAVTLQNPAAFWGEKKIPRWLRYGAASYVERYMKNPEAAPGADPWDLRTFAFGELKKAGGLHKPAELFAFTLDLSKADDSTRLYNEAGLVVAYLLDGAEGDKKLAAAHEAFKAALKSGAKKDVVEAADVLQKELAKHEAKIKKFAGL